MFEPLVMRVTRAADERAAAAARRLAAELAETLPDDIQIEAEVNALRLQGCRMRRRPVTRAAIEWAIAGLRR